MPRSEAPREKVRLKRKLRKYAKEHGLLVDYHVNKKVKWMEQHGGRCFCDWDSDRRCPCTHVQDDLVEFNGTCLCGALVTRDKMKRLRAYRRRVKAKREKERGLDAD